MPYIGSAKYFDNLAIQITKLKLNPFYGTALNLVIEIRNQLYAFDLFRPQNTQA